MNSVNDRTGNLDGKTLTDAVGAAAPTGVDQPNVRIVLGHIFSKQISILRRMPNEEGLAKASGESRLRLFDANLSTGNLSGVTANEVILSLFRRELTDRRKNAERVAGQEDNVLRMSAAASFLNILDVVNGIGSASIFGQRIVIEVNFTSAGIENGVLKNRSEFDRIVNFGFTFCGQVNALSVATTFDVDDAFVGPIMFVVADELTIGFGGKGSFTGSGETEEQASIAVFTCVGGTVHREEALLRHEVIHDREDALLHFTGILGSENDKFAAFEVKIDRRWRGQGGSRGIRLELTSVENYEIRFAKGSEFLLGGTNEHVVHEKGMISASANHANLDAIFRIPTSKSVDDVEVIASVQIIDSTRTVLKESGFRHLDVDGTPPNIIGTLGIVNHALILRTTTGLISRGIHQSASGSNRSLLESDRIFIKLRRSRVAKDITDGDTVLC